MSAKLLHLFNADNGVEVLLETIKTAVSVQSSQKVWWLIDSNCTVNVFHRYCALFALQKAIVEPAVGTLVQVVTKRLQSNKGAYAQNMARYCKTPLHCR